MPGRPSNHSPRSETKVAFANRRGSSLPRAVQPLAVGRQNGEQPCRSGFDIVPARRQAPDIFPNRVNLAPVPATTVPFGPSWTPCAGHRGHARLSGQSSDRKCAVIRLTNGTNWPRSINYIRHGWQDGHCNSGVEISHRSNGCRIQTVTDWWWAPRGSPKAGEILRRSPTSNRAATLGIISFRRAGLHRLNLDRAAAGSPLADGGTFASSTNIITRSA